MTTNSLAASLAKAQGEMENAAINKENPYFNSRYADLAAIRDATIPALSKNGLALFHTIEMVPGAYRVDNGVALPVSKDQWVVRGHLAHGASGESVTSDFPLPNAFDKPQTMGSAITYGKRYTWAALCGIAAEEDDDANAAQGHEAKPARQVRRPAPEPTPPPAPPETPTKPEVIPLGQVEGGKPDWLGWGQAYTSALRTAKTKDELEDWIVLNRETVSEMEERATKVHKRVVEVTAGIYEDMEKKSGS